MSSSKSLHSVLRVSGRSITVPTGLFINNKWVKGRGKSIVSINPANGKPVLPDSETICGSSKEDVDDAVKAARQAFRTTWGLNSTGTQRARLLHKLADLIEQNHERLSVVEALDSGKPIGWAKADVTDSVACLRYYAGHADKIVGQTLEVNSKTKQCFTKHEPIGVVAQIVPWNYPIMMWAWKVGPPLAVGCSIVFKPAENTSLSTLMLAELFAEAGYPEGVFNVVSGYGDETGVALATHAGIDKIAFTGSTATGRAITIAAAESNLKKVTLELGGKSANIIFPSADLDQAVYWAALGCFENAGQSCSAGSRILVHESIQVEFERRLVECAEKIKLGHPLDEETWQGPQVSQQQFERVMNHIAIGKKEGAKLLTGGARHGTEGFYIQPTVFTVSAQSKSTIAREEIFGPVVVVIPFKTEGEAIQLANDSEYGLAAALHSKDADQIGRVSNELEAGTVWINQYTFTANNVPFGGYKTSGWGRELGSYGLEEYISVKAVHWNYGERLESFPCKL